MTREPEKPSEAELSRGSQWFEWYTDTLTNNSINRPKQDEPYACPCCGYLTLDSRGGYQICDVCFWEDDGQDEHDAHVVRGGPNGALSLTQAQQNFAKLGACEARMLHNVREPLPEEHPLKEQP